MGFLQAESIQICQRNRKLIPRLGDLNKNLIRANDIYEKAAMSC